MRRWVAYGVGAAVLAPFATWGAVEVYEYRAEVYDDSYFLGYQDTGGDNPLAGVSATRWDEVTEDAVAECEAGYEHPDGADPGWPNWGAYCAGQWEGWADRLRGTYRPVHGVSWRGYDTD